jgi:hypothetical protein
MVGMWAYLQRGVHRSWSNVTRAAVPACVLGGPWSDEAKLPLDGRVEIFHFGLGFFEIFNGN